MNTLLCIKANSNGIKAKDQKIHCYSTVFTQGPNDILLLMEEIPHQLRWVVVCPLFTKVLWPSQVVFSPDFWTINSMMTRGLMPGMVGSPHRSLAAGRRGPQSCCGGCQLLGPHTWTLKLTASSPLKLLGGPGQEVNGSMVRINGL